MRPFLAAAVVATVALPARAGEPVERTSEHLTGVAEAWATPGFRLSLSVGYELLASLNIAPSGRSVAPALHLGWRLSPELSLTATLRYSAAHAGLGGLRASATAEPVWHVTDELELAAGVGYVATLLSNPALPGIPFTEIEDAVRAGRDPVLPAFGSCDGHGVTGLLRVAYLWRTGYLFATGPMLQIDAQWVSCTDDDFIVRNPGDVEEGTGTPLMLTNGPTVILHQPWTHLSVSASWVFAWR